MPTTYGSWCPSTPLMRTFAEGASRADIVCTLLQNLKTLVDSRAPNKTGEVQYSQSLPDVPIVVSVADQRGGKRLFVPIHRCCCYPKSDLGRSITRMAVQFRMKATGSGFHQCLIRTFER